MITFFLLLIIAVLQGIAAYVLCSPYDQATVLCCLPPVEASTASCLLPLQLEILSPIGVCSDLIEFAVQVVQSPGFLETVSIYGLDLCFARYKYIFFKIKT